MDVGRRRAAGGWTVTGTTAMRAKGRNYNLIWFTAQRLENAPSGAPCPSRGQGASCCRGPVLAGVLARRLPGTGLSGRGGRRLPGLRFLVQTGEGRGHPLPGPGQPLTGVLDRLAELAGHWRVRLGHGSFPGHATVADPGVGRDRFSLGGVEFLLGGFLRGVRLRFGGGRLACALGVLVARVTAGGRFALLRRGGQRQLRAGGTLTFAERQCGGRGAGGGGLGLRCGPVDRRREALACPVGEGDDVIDVDTLQDIVEEVAQTRD